MPVLTRSGEKFKVKPSRNIFERAIFCQETEKGVL